MRVLALETSTACGSVAIAEDIKVLSLRSSMRQRSHSESINPFVQECLIETKFSLDTFDIFAVGLGPGSFTGIRVAANIGKTFSYNYNKPLVAVSSLKLLAIQALNSQQMTSARTILCIINAYKNMCYTAIYQVKNEQTLNSNSLVEIVAPTVMTIPQLEAAISAETLVVGDGYSSYLNTFSKDLILKLKRDPDLSDFPLASTLALEAVKMAEQKQYMQWHEFVPLYIRASEAEETLQKKARESNGVGSTSKE